jgi:hypothetical protein
MMEMRMRWLVWRVARGWRRAAVRGVGLLLVGLVAGCGSVAHASGPRSTALAFKATTMSGGAAPGAVMDRAVAILRARARSVAPGTAVSRAGQRIVVRVSSGQVSGALAMVVAGRLEFYDWEANALTPKGRTVASALRTQAPAALLISQGSGMVGEGNVSLYEAVRLASTQPARGRSGSARRGPEYYMFAEPGSAACATAAKDQGERAVARVHCLLSGPGATKQELIADLPAGVRPDEGQILTVAQGTTVLRAASSSFRGPPSAADPTAQFYVLDDRPALTNQDVVDPRAATDPSGSPELTFGFTARGQRVSHDVTATLAHRARRLSAHGPALYQHLAVVLDDAVIDVPQIDYKQFPNGVPASQGAGIGGGFTTQFARELATVLRYGPLPVRLSRAG